MTEEQKEWIDDANYRDLLRLWRFSPVGDAMFKGDTGKYYAEVMARKRTEVGGAAHTAASKSIGWEDCGRTDFGTAGSR